MKEDYDEKVFTFTGQRSETVKYRKKSGETVAVLFSMKAGKWKMCHKAETHDLPFYLICHTMMKVTDSPNCWFYPQKNTASHHITLKAVKKCIV